VAFVVFQRRVDEVDDDGSNLHVEPALERRQIADRRPRLLIRPPADQFLLEDQIEALRENRLEIVIVLQLGEQVRDAVLVQLVERHAGGLGKSLEPVEERLLRFHGDHASVQHDSHSSSVRSVLLPPLGAPASPPRLRCLVGRILHEGPPLLPAPPGRPAGALSTWPRDAPGHMASIPAILP
jgi:hypothetical protein